MRNPGMGHIYLHVNRNKRSVVLDLKQPAGRDAALRLAEKSDVLVFNVRPKAMARLGLSYEDVKRSIPKSSTPQRLAMAKVAPTRVNQPMTI